MAEGMESKKLNLEELDDVNGGIRGGELSNNQPSVERPKMYYAFECKTEGCSKKGWGIGTGLLPQSSMICDECKQEMRGKW